ncbi:MAG: stage III sporulation protein AF [Firmicutes bacterium]|nr:stage III sporulation protein AF [Bacillota bacterium]
MLIEILKPWIMNIVIVVFFLLMTDVLLPEGNIRQYVKVVLGLFIILVIIKPLIDMNNINSNFENIYIETATFLETDSINADVEILHKYHKEKTLALYKKNIEKTIINTVSKELSINSDLIKVQLDLENKTDIYSGMIEHVLIIIPDKRDSNFIDKIKKVDIPNNKKVIYKDEKEYNFNDKAYVEDLKNLLTKLLPVEKENIEIKFTIDNGGDSK